MTVAPLLRRILRYGAILAVGVALVGGVVGLVVAGGPGLVGALLGAVASALFLALTAVSVLVAGRATHGDLLHPAFFAIVLGSWILKFVLFLVLGLWLRDQEWLQPVAFFVAVIVSVVGSLVVDVVAIQRSRMPYASDVSLPGEREDGPRG